MKTRNIVEDTRQIEAQWQKILNASCGPCACLAPTPAAKSASGTAGTWTAVSQGMGLYVIGSLGLAHQGNILWAAGRVVPRAKSRSFNADQRER